MAIESIRQVALVGEPARSSGFGERHTRPHDRGRSSLAAASIGPHRGLSPACPEPRYQCRLRRLLVASGGWALAL